MIVVTLMPAICNQMEIFVTRLTASRQQRHPSNTTLLMAYSSTISVKYRAIEELMMGGNNHFNLGYSRAVSIMTGGVQKQIEEYCTTVYKSLSILLQCDCEAIQG